MAELSPLRVLIVEDNQEDVALMLNALTAWGFSVVSQVATTEEEFRTAIASEEVFDAIVADYNLPSFTGAAAYELVRAENKSIPFLIVADVQDDEAHLELVGRGAADYLRKDRIMRLGPAVERSIEHQQLLVRVERGNKLGSQIARDLGDLAQKVKGDGADEYSTRLEEIIKEIDAVLEMKWRAR